MSLIIKSSTSNQNIEIDKNFYFKLVKEIYNLHYLEWYSHYEEPENIKKHLDALLERIKSEYVPTVQNKINVVNCCLYEHGKCKQITSETIIISKIKYNKHKQILRTIFLLITVGISIILQLIPNLSTTVNILCSMFALFTGIDAIRTLIKYF